MREEFGSQQWQPAVVGDHLRADHFAELLHMADIRFQNDLPAICHNGLRQRFLLEPEFFNQGRWKNKESIKSRVDPGSDGRGLFRSGIGDP